MNQCDGCQKGIPVDKDGNHVTFMRSGYISMQGCTKARYKTMPKTITTVDINASQGKLPVAGTTYYRITPDMVNFLKLCDDKHGIIGFEYEEGSLNFGVILKKK